jgi:hypothetical protein
MGLAERLASEMTPIVRGCAIGRLLDTLDTDDSRALASAIDNVRDAKEQGVNPQARTGITATAIARALGAEGHDISSYTVQNHVYGRCRCGR